MHAARVTGREAGQDKRGRQEDFFAFQPSIEGRLPIIMVLRQIRSVASQAIRQNRRDPPSLHGNLNGKDPTFDARFTPTGVGRDPTATRLS